MMLVKIRQFAPTPPQFAPSQGSHRWIFGVRKLGSIIPAELSYGVVCVILR